MGKHDECGIIDVETTLLGNDGSMATDAPMHVITQADMDAADILLGVGGDSQPSEAELAQIHAKMRMNNEGLVINKASL